MYWIVIANVGLQLKMLLISFLVRTLYQDIRNSLSNSLRSLTEINLNILLFGNNNLPPKTNILISQLIHNLKSKSLIFVIFVIFVQSFCI